MLSSSKGKVLKSKVDPCANCSKRVMYTKCSKWVHSRCMTMQRVTSTLAKGFVYKLCVDSMKGIVESSEKISFLAQVKFVKSFCYSGTG